MPAARIAALAVCALTLVVPAAHGHAWSDTHTLTTDGAGPVADMSRSGYAIAGWSASDGGYVATAAPGAGFGPAEKLATQGRGIADVAVAENGDAFALWYGSSGTVFVATREAGGTWQAGEQLPMSGGLGNADLVAGPDGDAAVITDGPEGARGAHTYQREAGDNAFAAGGTSTTSYQPFVFAGYVGDRVVIVGEVDNNQVATSTLEPDGTLSPSRKIDDISGPPGMSLATSDTGAVVAWPAFADTDGDGDSESHMRAARAGADGAFDDGEKVSGDLYKGVMYPDSAIAADGRTLVGWGDAEYDPVALVSAPSPTAPFAAATPPTVPGNRSDEIELEVDSRGADLAAWYFQDNAGGSATRVEVATRLPGQSAWCGAETLASHRANAYTLRLFTDGAARGFAIWQTPAAGPTGTSSVWVSRYAAKDDCPPTPPAPPAQEVNREEVVYLPPPPPPPVVTVVKRFVQLSLPKQAAVDRKGRVKLAVGCSGEAATCAGRLVLKRGRATWASRAFSLAKGRRTLTLQLRKAARKALKRRRRAAVTVELRLEGQAVRRARLTLARR
ncbi:MAG TPA: hypothetical protein VF549_09880 [Solirubrobacteraceae bacterium]|jgi:hypothetical protein